MFRGEFIDICTCSNSFRRVIFRLTFLVRTAIKLWRVSVVLVVLVIVVVCVVLVGGIPNGRLILCGRRVVNVLLFKPISYHRTTQ